MSRVRDDRPVLHGAEVLHPKNVDVPGHGHEDVAEFRGFRGGHDLEAVHDRLERGQRIDLGDRDVGAHAARPARDPAAAPAITQHDEPRAREEAVRGPQDSVDRALPRAVAIVEEVLRLRVVHREDRIPERPLAGHGPKADHAGRRLLGAGDHLLRLLRALRVEDGHEIGAVIHRELGLGVQRRVDVLVVGVGVLALDRERRNPIPVRERRGHVVLRGERVRGAERHVGAARLEREHEVGGLGRHVEARRHAPALQRKLLLEPRLHLAENRHLALRPFDSIDALVGELGVQDMPLRAHGNGGIRRHASSPPRGRAAPTGTPRSHGRSVRKLRSCDRSVCEGRGIG